MADTVIERLRKLEWQEPPSTSQLLVFSPQQIAIIESELKKAEPVAPQTSPQDFDEWFEMYSQNYSKDQWSLRDAWKAARRAQQTSPQGTEYWREQYESVWAELKLLRESNAAHARELLQARLDTLRDIPIFNYRFDYVKFIIEQIADLEQQIREL